MQGAPGIHILGAEEHRQPDGRSKKLEGPVEINPPCALPCPGRVKDEGFGSVREKVFFRGGQLISTAGTSNLFDLPPGL